MFGCRDATSLMTDEREGALSGWVRAKYRAHLLICVYCRRCRCQLDRTVSLSKDVPPAEVPRELEEVALDAFRARSGKQT
jgi:hypothetical protein